MYLHAERLLAKAGRQGARGAGISHPKLSEANEGAALLRDFAEQDYGEAPCAAPGQRPQRSLVSVFVRASSLVYWGGRCGRERPTEVGDGRRAASGIREETPSCCVVLKCYCAFCLKALGASPTCLVREPKERGLNAARKWGKDRRVTR
jgi:hypothetical protein